MTFLNILSNYGTFLKMNFFKMFFLETSIVRVAVLMVWKN